MKNVFTGCILLVLSLAILAQEQLTSKALQKGDYVWQPTRMSVHFDGYPKSFRGRSLQKKILPSNIKANFIVIGVLFRIKVTGANIGPSVARHYAIVKRVR
jgi:hypothetical protein